MEIREEDNIMKEEQFESMQDELDSKTRKLKKLFNKYKNIKEEKKDLTEENSREREDLVDTIRELRQENKRNQLVLDYFIPPDIVEMLNRKAVWDEKSDAWIIPRKNLVGNGMRGRRPVSATGLRRPETDYAKHRKKFSTNPRYRSDNIANFELDMPDRTTADYEGPAISQRVKAALDAALIGEDNDEIQFDSPENLPEFNPYLNYQGEEPDRKLLRQRQWHYEECVFLTVLLFFLCSSVFVVAGDREEASRSKSRKKSKERSSRRKENSSRSKNGRKRPGTAGRHGRGSRKERDEAPVDEPVDVRERRCICLRMCVGGGCMVSDVFVVLLFFFGGGCLSLDQCRNLNK